MNGSFDNRLDIRFQVNLLEDLKDHYLTNLLRLYTIGNYHPLTEKRLLESIESVKQEIKSLNHKREDELLVIE